MEDKNTSTQKDFKKSRIDDLESGALKFSTDYVSTQLLFEAAEQWAEEDSNVQSLSIRIGGAGQLALDFKYDTSNEPDERKRGATLDKIFKPFFKKALGGDYIIGWDYSSPTTIVK